MEGSNPLEIPNYYYVSMLRCSARKSGLFTGEILIGPREKVVLPDPGERSH